MADFGAMGLTWLGNDRVQMSVTSGSSSSGLFSTNISSKNSQAVLKMDRARFEYESQQIQNSGKVSLEMQIKENAYYRKIDDILFQYDQTIHGPVEDGIERANYIFKTGVQGIRVGDKRNPRKTIGVPQPNGRKHLNFLLLFLDDAFYAVAGDEIHGFSYAEISDAEYSFGFTKKRISFVYNGDKCHMWIYSADKEDVKSAVGLMESSRSGRDSSIKRSEKDSNRKSKSTGSSKVCPSCQTETISWNQKRSMGYCSSCGQHYKYKQGQWVSQE